MALSIKKEEADRLARELARTTGESMTDAVVIALQERLDRVRRQRATGVAQRLRRLAADARDLPVLDARPADAILGYGDHGLPT
jgi:antitoxin VapB